MSLMYLLANFTLALSMQPHMQIVTTLQIHNPQTFIGWNAKQRCEDARRDRMKSLGRSRFGQQEIVGPCMDGSL